MQGMLCVAPGSPSRKAAVRRTPLLRYSEPCFGSAIAIPRRRRSGGAQHRCTLLETTKFEDCYAFTPMAEIVAMRHEVQSSRLFAN
jgi:hypothetical protein